MSVSSRSRFNPESPFPERGVISPNVFPSPVQGRHGRLDLHDILDGKIPKTRNGQTPRSGWLRIAIGNGQDMDYYSPHLGEAELNRRRGKSRKSLSVDVDVEETRVIKRVATVLNAAALEVPSFDGAAFRFMEDDPELMKTTPVEQAIFFRGIAAIRGEEAGVSGIHFDSGEENGWLLIGEPLETLDQAA